MIMRITWGKLRAGCWQEYEQAYRATVADTAVPGLRGRWLAQDVQDPDGGFAVSVWDSLEAMQAYEQSAVFRQEIQPTLPFFVGGSTPPIGVGVGEYAGRSKGRAGARPGGSRWPPVLDDAQGWRASPGRWAPATTSQSPEVSSSPERRSNDAETLRTLERRAAALPRSVGLVQEAVSCGARRAWRWW